MAWALAVACVASSSCGRDGEPGQRLAGVRAPVAVHALKASAKEAAALVKLGATPVADYGSFQLLAVPDALLGQVAPSPGVELRDDFHQILLNAGALDTQAPPWAAMRAQRPTRAGKALHLVQFVGPVRAQWLTAIAQTGVRVVTYIPNNAYLVWGDLPALGRLQTLATRAPELQWDGDYLPDFKLDPTLAKVATDTYALQLVEDADTNPGTLAAIAAVQKREPVIRRALGYVNVVVAVDRAVLAQLAQRPDVVSIQPRPTPIKLGERQDLLLSGNRVGNLPGPAGYLSWLASKGFTQAAFTRSGFGVDVSDSGLDNGTLLPNHFGLYVQGDVLGQSRVAYNRLVGTPHWDSTLQGCDGHGTFNGHIIGGFDDLTQAPFADASGYAYGLGVAPFVRLGSSVVFDPYTFTEPDYAALESMAYADGMRISSNSWGGESNLYDADAQQYDALVRDAQPTGSTNASPGNQEMVIVFAAGNAGPGGNSVGSPSTAKNVLTAGASEGVQVLGGADYCAASDADADSAEDIASFSSRGPTADGRFKPDLVAPGTHISGGVAQSSGQRADPPASAMGSALSCFDASGVCGGAGDDFFPAGQNWYTASDGTSHSTPAIAGGAALLRQHFLNQGWAPASPAMTKAYLMSAAHYLTGAGANDTLASNNQGMGLLDLGMAFDGTPRLLNDQRPENLFTATGQTRAFSGVVAESDEPFRVTLAWTDAPGSTSGGAWKNDLDLVVTVGANTYKGNVFTGPSSGVGGVADTKNNVESVFLPAGVTGGYTVTVTAANINSDGVPGNASPLDQDFALVVYNSCSAATPAEQLDSCPTQVPPPGPAVRYRLDGIPASSQAGSSTSFSVTALDATDQTAVGYGGTASFSSSDASATLPASAAFVSGVASGVPLTFATAGTQTVTAVDSSEASITGSASTVVSAATPTALSFSVPPTDGTAGVGLTPAIQVQLLDGTGKPTSGAVAVTLSLGNNPTADTLGGTRTVTTDGSGAASYGGLTLEKAGEGYTLVASAPGFADVHSAAFSIGPNLPAALAWSTQPSTVAAGAVISPAVSAVLVDAYGNPTHGTGVVTVALGPPTAGGTLAGTTSVSAVDGLATFGDLRIDRANTGYQLVASSAGLSSSTSLPFEVTAGAPARLTLTSAPSAGTAGEALAPLTVRLEDAQGNTVTRDSTSPVSVSLGANVAGGTLLGTSTVTASSGTATFEGLSIRKAGSGFTLVVHGEGYGTATSSAFAIAAGPAARLAVSLPATAKVLEPVVLSAGAFDAYDNLASAYAHAVQVTSTDPAAQLPSGATFSRGKLGPLSVTFHTPGKASVTLTDAAAPELKASVQVDVTSAAGSVTPPPPEGGCGCTQTSDAQGGAMTLGVFGLWVLLRRRRMRRA